MDKVGKPKDKYMLLNGFMKGIVFSQDSADEKVNDLQALSDAFDESLHKELENYNQNQTKTVITNKETGEIYTINH